MKSDNLRTNPIGVPSADAPALSQVDVPHRSATHGAGHAVGWLPPGSSYGHGTVDRQELESGLVGSVDFDYPLDNFHQHIIEGSDSVEDWDEVWRALVVTFAGPAAEEIISGDLLLDSENKGDRE